MGLFHSKVNALVVAEPLQQELATSSAPESNISSRGPVAFHGARDTQINGGTFNVAEIINHTVNHHYAAAPPDNNLLSKIQDWLAPSTNFKSIQIETFKKRTPDTGKWLLEGEIFQQWLNGKEGILWGVGMPGSGKTVIASIVVDYLKTHAKELDPGEISLAYAYSRYTEEVPVEEILTGLSEQQLKRFPSLIQFVEPLYRQHDDGKTNPTRDELVDLLVKFATVFKLSFYILDGVDEARKDVQFDLVKALRSINAHFFLTSRPLDNLKSRLPEAQIFPVVAHDDDIILLISEIIEDNPEFPLLLVDEAFKQEVIAKILEKSAGMFLHAALQLKALQECVNEDEIRSKLDELPAGLDGMYNVTIARIEKQPSNRVTFAKRILALVVHAERPLSVEELQYAAAADLETHTFSPGRIVSEAIFLAVCCGLIYVEAQSDGWSPTERIVRLIHFTAKDALHRILLKDFPSPHAFLTSTCISRLISCNFHESGITDERELGTTFNDEPFLHYAYDYWHSHARKCDILSPDSQCIPQFLTRCQAFPLRLDVFKGDWLYHGLVRGAGIHVASSFDLLHTLSNIPDPNLPALDSESTPLLLALAFSPLISSTNCVMVLLNLRGIDVNAAEPREGATPLLLAAWNGYADVVGRLLKFPDIKVNAKDIRGETALIHAARKGHIDIVNLLLQHESIDVDIADNRGVTPLMIATIHGHADVVELLLEYNPPIHLDSPRCAWAEFMQASKQGCLDRLEQLLRSSDIPINNTDQNGYTALIFASFYGNESIVQWLLQLPTIQVNLEAKNGYTALVVAAERGHINVVRHLLAFPGIEVNKPGQTFHSWGTNRTTALITACQWGYGDIVGQLLQYPGIDVNATDEAGRTALICSSVNDNIVGQLLQHPRIDVNLADMQGDTALMSASRYGKSDIVEQLLQCTGVNVNAIDGYGTTALAQASVGGHLAVVEQLLRFPGIQLELADTYGDTALILAERVVSPDHTAVAQCIRQALVKQSQSTEP